jgi:hypothetical protein
MKNDEEIDDFLGLLDLVFKVFADNPNEENRKIAHYIYRVTRNADFRWYELSDGIEERMEKLGLAQLENDGWKFGPITKTKTE